MVPVPGFAAFTEVGVVEVKAVGGGPAARACRELPPELRRLAVSGEVEQAGVDESALDVEGVFL
ncbi:hypothetical protein ACFWIA_27970 [Streptomyces sp. NPDC127068]|uniref:hypothetical protein n=1 Tax=Streptomyces sp. NPDC127068 TaxID=3347127 RepID=UPI0036517D4B